MSQDIKMPTGTERFQQATSLIFVLIDALSVLWVLTMRKFGTLGTRTYMFSFVWALGIIAVMHAGTTGNDKVCFHIAAWWLLIGWWIHFAATGYRRRTHHVHSHDIGLPRFLKGQNGYLFEVIVGSLWLLVANHFKAPIFGLYMFVSSFCAALTYGLVQERDKIRVLQVKDSIMEQRRYVDGFGTQNSV
jgi:hypothetical protein